ncbi:unnamed protein product [Litomosoides sigmodontis]|uniref:CX domain-containing protein n=1 Tax=Litomosoides sigmodontis TaxID=42156 RepID=A0A3P6SXN1_LITSI|nr:unnamed protein product [Litomosoides sigmodontis]
MNSDHTFLTILLSTIELIKGDGRNPLKFFSTFGNATYYYQSGFSNQSSFLKLRDHLQSNNVVRNDSQGVVIFNVGNLNYQLHTYENIVEQPKVGKSCHLKVFEIKELRNIFIGSSGMPVNHIYWTCPPYAWCCGAECCEPFYKQNVFRDPWPILGPDFFKLVVAVIVFAGLLVIPELYRRWGKRKIDNTQQSTPKSPTGTSGSNTENSEKSQFIA